MVSHVYKGINHKQLLCSMLPRVLLEVSLLVGPWSNRLSPAGILAISVILSFSRKLLIMFLAYLIMPNVTLPFSIYASQFPCLGTRGLFPSYHDSLPLSHVDHCNHFLNWSLTFKSFWLDSKSCKWNRRVCCDPFLSRFATHGSYGQNVNPSCSNSCPNFCTI